MLRGAVVGVVVNGSLGEEIFVHVALTRGLFPGDIFSHEPGKKDLHTEGLVLGKGSVRSVVYIGDDE